MKQPKRQTRKQRQQAAATNTAVTDVGDMVKNNAGAIVNMLDKITKSGLPDRVIVLLHPQGSLHIQGVEFDSVHREELAQALAGAELLDLANAVLRGLQCGHIMLLLSLPSGIQGCCPECDYDVRGRKTN